MCLEGPVLQKHTGSEGFPLELQSAPGGPAESRRRSRSCMRLTNQRGPVYSSEKEADNKKRTLLSECMFVQQKDGFTSVQLSFAQEYMSYD